MTPRDNLHNPDQNPPDNVIAIVTDANYAKYAEIMLFQISRYSPWKTVCILIDGDEALERELSSKALSLGLKPMVFKVNDLLDQVSKKISKQRITRVALSRLFLPEILPSNINRVLYLDLDLLIRRDLSPICNFDLKLPIAAVGNQSFRIRKLLNTPDLATFNSGVMLIDCARWREFESKSKFEEILENGLPIPFMDEILLNLVFKDLWQQLPVTANVFSAKKLRTQSRRGPDNPIVVHFLGRAKPWLAITGKYSIEWRTMYRESGIVVQNGFAAKVKAFNWFLIEEFGRSKIGYRLMVWFSGSYKKRLKSLLGF